MIEVCCAVVVRNQRLLMSQRLPSQDLPWLWELPGSRVAGPHESHHDAVRRALKTKLGVGILRIPEHAVWCGEILRCGQKESAFVLFYQVDIGDQEPRALEGQGLGWFRRREVGSLSAVSSVGWAEDTLDDVLRAHERAAVSS